MEAIIAMDMLPVKIMIAAGPDQGGQVAPKEGNGGIVGPVEPTKDNENGNHAFRRGEEG